MPAGTSVITMTSDAIATALSTVGGIVTIWQGKHRDATATTEDSVRAYAAEVQGLFYYKLRSRTARNQTTMGEVEFVGSMMIRLPKDDSSDCNPAYDLCEEACAALAKEANFVSSGTRPDSITWEPSNADRHEDDVAVFEFRMRYLVGPPCD